MRVNLMRWGLIVGVTLVVHGGLDTQRLSAQGIHLTAEAVAASDAGAATLLRRVNGELGPRGDGQEPGGAETSSSSGTASGAAPTGGGEVEDSSPEHLDWWALGGLPF